MPELHALYQEVCKKLNIKDAPELHILQAGGFLNAFATRHAGRNFVVLNSELVEAYDLSSEEMRFVLGHELGHVRSKHLIKNLFILPALIFPLLRSAYSRACESSCDRYGAYSVNDIAGAVKAMMILSGGKYLGRRLDSIAFAEQSKTERGFFVSWNELISGYPTLSQRVAALIAFRDGAKFRYPRNPFAYLFAFFTFGTKGGSIGGMIVSIAVFYWLAVTVVPVALKARLFSNEELAKATIEKMGDAAGGYTKANGSYPQDGGQLLQIVSAGLTQDFCGKSVSGYSYGCEFAQDGFGICAIPTEKGITGTKQFCVTQEGVTEEVLK